MIEKAMPEDPKAESLELLKKIAQGDRNAFSRFYDLYSSLVYTFAMRVLRSRTESEDLLQEIFLNVWNKAASYDAKRGKPEAWLIMMTKSRAIDKIRSVRRRDRDTPELEEVSKHLGQEQGVRADASLEVKLTVDGALSELSDVQREVLEMAYFEGMTQTEISDKLGVPLGTVKTRIRDGLKRLRAVLKTGAKV